MSVKILLKRPETVVGTLDDKLRTTVEGNKISVKNSFILLLEKRLKIQEQKFLFESFKFMAGKVQSYITIQ